MKTLSTKTSTLIVATFTSFWTPFMMSAVGIALPEIGREFAIDAVLLSWIATSYLLAAAVFLVPFGKIGDIYGRKRVFSWGIALFTICTFLCALAPSPIWLIAIRCAQGFAGAMIATAGVAIITSVFPPQERGKAIGITVAAVYVGLSVGPYVGGLITDHLGWRYVFLATAPFGAVAFFLAVKMLKGEWADAKGEKLDVWGSVLYGVALTALLYGASILPGATGIVLVSSGLLGLTAFVLYELRTSFPVFEVRLFAQNRPFAFSNLAAFIHYTATFAVTFLLSLYLQYVRGMSAHSAGLILLTQPVMQAIFSPFAGRLSDRIEPGIVASIGMAFTSVGLFLLIFVGDSTSTIYIVGTLALLGFGYAIFSSPNMSAIMGSVEKQYYGIASGSVATMRAVGMAVSMAVVTVLFSIMIGKAEITPEVYDAFSGSVKVALIIFTALCLAGIVPSLARGKIH